MQMSVYGIVVGSVLVIFAAPLLVRFFEIRELSAFPFVLSTSIVAAIGIPVNQAVAIL